MPNPKYIIIKYREIETPIIFAPWIKHSEMANAFQKHEVVSAGFVCQHNGNLITYGKAETLKLAPQAHDGKLINLLFKELQ